MDVNAVTAALQDLLGPDVRRVSLSPPGYHAWKTITKDRNPVTYNIWDDGEIGLPSAHEGRDLLSVAHLDKLHAASQIVRRMVTQ